MIKRSITLIFKFAVHHVNAFMNLQPTASASCYNPLLHHYYLHTPSTLPQQQRSLLHHLHPSLPLSILSVGATHQAHVPATSRYFPAAFHLLLSLTSVTVLAFPRVSTRSFELPRARNCLHRCYHGPRLVPSLHRGNVKEGLSGCKPSH